jgi:hypothetical protein
VVHVKKEGKMILEKTMRINNQYTFFGDFFGNKKKAYVG